MTSHSKALLILGLAAATMLKAQTGEQVFNSSCAACHNLDGRGGGHAPDISGGSTAQSYSDERLAGIIHKGIPNLGMPAFASLPPQELDAVVRYLRTLQKAVGEQSSPVSGNAIAGRAAFFGKAQCFTCHMAERSGGFIASDLSGTRLTTEAIRQSILHPPATGADKITTLTLMDGTRVSGLVRNEDNFSMQLQALDGTFYLVERANTRKIETATQTFMPSDYARSLSPAELEDVVAFVAGLPKKF